MMIFTIVMAIAVDYLLGEPKRFHPLVVFGALADRLEKILWQDNRLSGIMALLIILTATVVLAFILSTMAAANAIMAWLIPVLVVYITIAPRSLTEHAMAVSAPLCAADIEQARYTLSMMVSRDTDELDERAIASATCESVLENGSDGIFAAIFWFCLFGLYGVLIYRVVNTLDAMWGYKNKRYRYFGWAAAKLDDGLNYLPARLVALSYSLVGNFSQGIQCWFEQGRYWKSPNAGPVMAAGAGSLNIILGGEAVYGGQLQSRPALGCGNTVEAEDIAKALDLLKRSLILWVLVIAILDWIF
ncbi:adenosylcobinamide-phosphate synthase CbiB [Oceanicoccus sagamiensis]|uniref:Cobalamin biosynthesis protein CobD n=1 Tax=Oceanicoccus sagamiensis TaxID=716816 RepID=A0A1X9NLG6_9GAMM|nr:adenosylcobinamide-phosphate synthase CbiB [Oceanicoccus sagamiensis]ARN74783.1 hypothetical protein BST96_12030 [Oceanicoccus sagamiensis]